jgi:hypothetical protein
LYEGVTTVTKGSGIGFRQWAPQTQNIYVWYQHLT